MFIKTLLTYRSGRTVEVELEGKDFREAATKFLKFDWQIFNDGVINTREIESIKPIN